MAQKKAPVKRMTKEEKEQWDELYMYVKYKVMQYDEEQSLSTQMVLRLKGLLTSKYMENSNIKSKSDYTYNTILLTFKACNSDIQKGFRSNRFNNEMHKFNYALKIVEDNINTIYIRQKQAKKNETKSKELDLSHLFNDGAKYQKKTVENTNERLKGLWNNS